MFPVSVLNSGNLFYHLYNWFIVPQFDVKPMGFFMATGIFILISLLKHKNSPSDDKKPSEMLESIFSMQLVYLLTLLIGFIVSRFI
jgi:hypothetical protein